MTDLLSLGEMYPSDFLKEGEAPTTPKVELKLVLDDNKLVRLEKTAPLNKLYGKYWYRSGVNQTMRDALRDVVESIEKVKPKATNHEDIWLDLACNDGTLLSYVDERYQKFGIDPAEDSYKVEALKSCDFHVQDFFSAEAFKEKRAGKKASVVTSIAMFYDVPDPDQFIRDVYDVLEDDGLWVMQLSYTPLMIRQMAFDNICHEHIYYYSLLDLRRILAANGFIVTDCTLNDVNGGSMRLFIRKGKEEIKHSIGYFRVASLCAMEIGMGMDDPGTWTDFYVKINELRLQTRSYISYAKKLGKTVWAYGASTKGNTLLQYFGLDNTMIDAIAERNPDKVGTRTIGTNIPIMSEANMRLEQPDYLLILPWHFIEEFKKRESEYLQKGGKFIVPCPEFKIIEK